MEKIAYYAVFGGLPNILSQIIPEKGIEGNIEDLILSEEGFARYYVESVIDKEISPINNGEIIIKRIGNGKKHYSQIESSISDEKKRKQLSKTLKELTEAHLIEKMNPINKPDDKKKSFYFISSNLIRFHMTYVIGAQITGSKKAYFGKYISPSLNTFISYRFEDIAKQYFGKDKSWLYQRLNNATVNGKPISFTQDELKTLADSLGDLSNRLSAISSIIHRSL